MMTMTKPANVGVRMKHLLLLEDELPLREIFRITIEMLDRKITLHEFGKADDAVPFIKERWEDINLYVLDIRVPGELDGFGLAKEIRALDKDTPIILTSAFAKPPKTELDEYNIKWMAKPWHLMEIPDKIVPLMSDND